MSKDALTATAKRLKEALSPIPGLVIESARGKGLSLIHISIYGHLIRLGSHGSHPCPVLRSSPLGISILPKTPAIVMDKKRRRI